MTMVLLSSMHKCIIYYIIHLWAFEMPNGVKRERENIAVFSVSTDNSLSYSFLDMSLISGYRIIPLLYEVVKRENTYLIFVYTKVLYKGLIEDDKYHLAHKAWTIGSDTILDKRLSQEPLT